MNFNLTFSKKGQGALEYLIIIGAAILVAVIVVSLIISVSRANTDITTTSNEQYTNMIDNTIIPPMIIGVDCNAVADRARFTINPSITEAVSQYCLVVNGDVNITNCQNTNSVLTFPYNSFVNGTAYRMSLVGKRGNVFSSPTAPPTSCTAHN